MTIFHQISVYRVSDEKLFFFWLAQESLNNWWMWNWFHSTASCSHLQRNHWLELLCINLKFKCDWFRFLDGPIGTTEHGHHNDGISENQNLTWPFDLRRMRKPNYFFVLNSVHVTRIVVKINIYGSRNIII